MDGVVGAEAKRWTDIFGNNEWRRGGVCDSGGTLFGKLGSRNSFDRRAKECFCWFAVLLVFAQRIRGYVYG
jgi:hypothetical protein